MAQVGGTCYADDASALQAVAALQTGTIADLGGAAYVVDSVPVVGGVAVTLSPIGGGASITSTHAVTLQPCVLLDWSDGLELGWAIGAVWVLTAAVMSLRKAVDE